MKQTKVQATANPNKNNELEESRTCEFEIPMPETVKEAGESFGEEVTLSKVNQSVIIDAQGVARRKLEQGWTAEQIQSYFENVNFQNPDADAKPWMPGVAPTRKSKVDKLVSGAADMSDEEFDAFIRKIREQRKGK